MPSRALAIHLEALLHDAEELGVAHTRLRTGARGRQWGLGAINRASVVLCVSAWEAYLEEVLRESMRCLRPSTGPVGTWSTLNAMVENHILRFNAPNVENTARLFKECLGLPDVTETWRWRNCSRTSARTYLNQALQRRHQIAHGVNPRPAISNVYSGWLPHFFRNLATRTDAAVSAHLRVMLGLPGPPW
jgi:hypothetical protein